MNCFNPSRPKRQRPNKIGCLVVYGKIQTMATNQLHPPTGYLAVGHPTQRGQENGFFDLPLQGLESLPQARKAQSSFSGVRAAEDSIEILRRSLENYSNCQGIGPSHLKVENTVTME